MECCLFLLNAVALQGLDECEVKNAQRWLAAFRGADGKAGMEM
jgi:hypothetical protein